MQRKKTNSLMCIWKKKTKFLRGCNPTPGLMHVRWVHSRYNVIASRSIHSTQNYSNCISKLRDNQIHNLTFYSLLFFFLLSALFCFCRKCVRVIVVVVAFCMAFVWFYRLPFDANTRRNMFCMSNCFVLMCHSGYY